MMAEEPQEQQEPTTDPAEVGATEAPPPRRRWKKWAFIGLGLLVLLPFAIFTLWAGIALTWSFSKGDRAGYVQKFSKRGWVCKTWEGELSMVNVPGQAQERWYFSVRDDSIARVITENMGNRVTLTYEEHPGVPTSCFGETDYYVVGARRVP
jgi:hypothetical protein